MKQRFCLIRNIETFSFSRLSYDFVIFALFTLVSSIAERLEIINYMNIKPRRILKGHQAKVLCSNWSPDKRHIVSSSQDGRLIIWDAFSTNKVINYDYKIST